MIDNTIIIVKENIQISNNHNLTCKCGNRTKFNIKYYENTNTLKIKCKRCDNYISF